MHDSQTEAEAVLLRLSPKFRSWLKNLPLGVAPKIDVRTRHAVGCPHRLNNGNDSSAKYYRNCRCPKQFYVNSIGNDRRFTANTRSWEEAEGRKQSILDLLDPVKAELRRLKAENSKKRIAIAEAVNAHLADHAVQGLAEQTTRYSRWFLLDRFLPWTEKEGLNYIAEVTTAQLTKWRSTWKAAPKTMIHWQAKVSALFNFSIRQGWCSTNPVAGLSKIKDPKKPVRFFSQSDYLQLILATCFYGNWTSKGRRRTVPDKNEVARLRAFVLLLRWSGLRLGDAAILEKARLDGNRLLLYQDKTGNPVFTVLPPLVVQALRCVPSGPNPSYYFWTGIGQLQGASAQWGRRLGRLFRIAGLRNNEDGTAKRARAHMFRHTFAIHMLTAGARLEDVSKLLGHASVKTTERHYIDWVPERQQHLEKVVKSTWAAQGIVVLARPGSAGAPAACGDHGLAASSIEAIRQGLSDFSSRIIAGAADGSNCAAVLKALGISVREEGTGALCPANAIILDIAEVFSRMPDGTVKTALAVALFGRQQDSLIAVLNRGRARVQSVMGSFGQSGVTAQYLTPAA